jgi:hypothetical protein
MDEHLNKKMNRDKYRFTLTYGEDTIITSFGSMKHQELISIGHAVNVAHKLEKIVKENNCYIGMDAECEKIARKNLYFSSCRKYNLPSELYKNKVYYDYWYGVKTYGYF